MEIFISWSGVKSKAAAEALRDWLPDVFHAAKPWMSSTDILPGKRWGQELKEKLKQSSFGIICVTSQNLDAPWIIYEVGNLANAFENAFVCPVLLDLSPNDISHSPLSQFQAVTITKDGIFSLIKSINNALGTHSLTDKRLQRSFNKWWTDIEEKLKCLPEEKNLPIIEESTERKKTTIQNEKKMDDIVNKIWPELKKKIDKLIEINQSKSIEIPYEILVSDAIDEMTWQYLRNFACYHQGEIIQYIFLSGEHHKALKTAFLDNQEITLIREKHDELINYLNEKLADIILKSFELIQKFHLGRHCVPPRICLKGRRKGDGRKGDGVEITRF